MENLIFFLKKKLKQEKKKKKMVRRRVAHDWPRLFGGWQVAILIEVCFVIVLSKSTEYGEAVMLSQAEAEERPLVPWRRREAFESYNQVWTWLLEFCSQAGWYICLVILVFIVNSNQFVSSIV